MNRKNSKKSSTPKKKPKKSSDKSRKTRTATPNKSTPVKTRSLRSRTLPKSPISESMKQSKINEYFKPISPSIGFIETQTSSQAPQQEVCQMIAIQRKVTKGPKVLKPIFGEQKRYSLRKSNESNSAKKLKFDSNEDKNQCLDDSNQSVCEPIESDNSLAEKLLKVSKNKMSKNKRVNNPISGQNLDQMMNSLKINANEKSPTIATKVLKSSVESDSSEDNRALHMCDSNVNHLCDKVVNNLDEDIDLMPVFKKPEVPKLKKGSKENTDRYLDKDKEKKLSYFLKNLSRLKRDKEMLSIQSIEEMEIEIQKEKSEETLFKSDFLIKSFEGIDIFGDYIPKTTEKYLSVEPNECLQESTVFSKLSLNRLLALLPLHGRRMKESERQQLISHIINSVSIEENQIICSQSEYKLIEILSENDSEIYLSLILKEFYRILSQISKNLRNISDSDPNDFLIKKELILLSNVIRAISQILSKSSFKIEADSVEELIKVLIISFGLGLDYRLIKNGDQIMEIKNLIAVILNNLFVDEIKAIPIIENLISFCMSEDKSDVMIALQIASLFPLNIDFELKRKFCISVIKLFVTKDIEFEMNLNEIRNILEEIDWKSLSHEDIYVIIQMIGLSLDLPKDLIEYKQTIASILGILDNKINSWLPKGSEFELSEIPKLLMILRTKVNVSTKSKI